MAVISITHPEFQMPELLRKYACLEDDGFLYFARQVAPSNVKVMLHEYTNRLEKKGFTYKIMDVGQDDIQRRSATALAQTKGSSSIDTDAMRHCRHLLESAVAATASDVHIIVNDITHSAEIKFRVHGDIVHHATLDAETGRSIATALHDIWADSGAGKKSSFIPKDYYSARIGRKAELPDTLNGIRLESAGTFNGFHMPLRLLYDAAENKGTLRDLGFQSAHISTFDMISRTPSGMVLISGPTGSGKSTTLNRYLRGYIEQTQGRRVVLTIEDPVEMAIPGALQREIPSADTEVERQRHFMGLMRNALRSDPDVIMFGEIRDKASAEIAMHAAMTGHQALATVHANNVIGSLERMVDMGVSKNLVYDPHNIIGLVSQRLVRRLCPHCKIPLMDVIDKLERRIDERIRSAAVNLSTAHVLGEGCEHCNHRGVVDREVVAEVVRTDHVFMEFLLQGKKMEALQHLRSQMKIETMLSHALSKINAGIVCPLDAERFVGNLDADVTWRDFKIDIDEITRGHGDTRYEL